jgi:hypothetical protein
MACFSDVELHLVQARDVPELLDAAYEAFEVLLSALEDHEDAGDPRFAAFVMAASCAANGRDAVLFSPSLPPRRLARQPPATLPYGDEKNGADAIAGLAGLVAARLTQAAGWAVLAGDQTGCRDAARYGRQIEAILARGDH